MIRIAICDDEKYMSDTIKTMVSDFFRRKAVRYRIDGVQVRRRVVHDIYCSL